MTIYCLWKMCPGGLLIQSTCQTIRTQHHSGEITICQLTGSEHFLLNVGGEFSPSGLNEGFRLRISNMKRSGVASDADDCSHEDS